MPTPKVNVLADDERLEEAVLSRLTRLEVREHDSEATLAALRFNLTQQPTGSFAILDDETFGPGDPLAVELEAPGGLTTRLFDGFVTHVRPHFEEIESNCYVEVLAMDAAVLLDAEERTASYVDASHSEAVAEVFDRYQIPFEGDETGERFEQDRFLLVQRDTDWRFVSRLARHNGFACYFEHDPDRGQVVGHFRRRALELEPQADLTIQTEGANLKWIDLQLVFSGPARHTGLAIDPLRKRLVRAAGDGELAELGDGRLGEVIESGLIDAGAAASAALLRDPFPGDAAITAQSNGLTDLSRFVIEARGEIDPALYRGLLRARRPVLVKGVGDRLSGVFYVRSVRTTLEEDELAQTFVAERNGWGQLGSEEFGQEAEEVPPQ